jgi:hypothetical protein
MLIDIIGRFVTSVLVILGAVAIYRWALSAWYRVCSWYSKRADAKAVLRAHLSWMPDLRKATTRLSQRVDALERENLLLWQRVNQLATDKADKLNEEQQLRHDAELSTHIGQIANHAARKHAQSMYERHSGPIVQRGGEIMRTFPAVLPEPIKIEQYYKDDVKTEPSGDSVTSGGLIDLQALADALAGKKKSS